MAEIRSRADVVARRLEEWGGDLDAIEAERRERVEEERRDAEFLAALGELAGRAMLRTEAIENARMLGEEPPDDPEGDEAVEAYEALAARLEALGLVYAED